MSAGAVETRGLTRITLLQTPPSLNKIGARGNPIQFHRRKKGWQQLIEGELMFGTGLGLMPRRVERVIATGRLEFRLIRRRDEGNYRTLLEKALGDALVGEQDAWPEGHWLADDTPERYRFDRLEIVSGTDEDRTILDLAWELA